jgi:inhibitor of cysteine peptidase
MKLLLGVVLLAFSIIATAGDDTTMNVNSSDTNFVVKLEANPTTGYQWSVVQYDKDLLTLSGSKYQSRKTQLIGAGGQMLFTFTLNKGKSYPAMTKMVFKYERSWEPESGMVKNVTINFVKAPKS